MSAECTNRDTADARHYGHVTPPYAESNGYYAHCICGWRSKERRTTETAHQELESHLNVALTDMGVSFDAVMAERDAIMRALGEPCAECGHIDWRSDDKAIDPLVDAVVEMDRLRVALTEIRDELGVPGPGYPAPVANAADIAARALAGRETTT